MNTLRMVIVVSLFSCIVCKVVQGVELTPAVDGEFNFSYSYDTPSIKEYETTIRLERSGYYVWDYRGVLEFDISSIPDSATIDTATLELDIYHYTDSAYQNPTISVYGYSGNGTLEAADAQVAINFLAQTDPVEKGVLEIPLDKNYIQSLLTTSDYLGLLVVDDFTTDYIMIVSTEGDSPANDMYAPKLVITVPEPVTLGLLTVGGLVLLRRK